MAYFVLTVALAFVAGVFLIIPFVLEAIRAKASPQVGAIGEAEGAIVFRMLAPITRAFVPMIESWRLPKYRERMSRKIMHAGLHGKLGVDEFIANKIVLTVLLPCGVLMLLGLKHAVIGGCLAGIAGFLFPDFWLYDVTRIRNRKILRALPYVVDLLALCVEAGLDFSAAISEVVAKAEKSPVRDELELFLTETRLGRTRRKALDDLSERVDLADVRSFCSVLIQADILGTGISEALKAQAEKMRSERFQRAEKAAAAASQKILFPIVLFILPSVFVIILGLLVVYFVYSSPL